MKGMELPINVMVIIVICVIVLLAIVALFFGVWNPGKGSITLETAKNNACQMLASMGCHQAPESIAVRDFDANRNGALNDQGGIGSEPWVYNDNCPGTAGSGDNLATLCLCYYNLLDADSCRKTLCGCNL